MAAGASSPASASAIDESAPEPVERPEPQLEPQPEPPSEPRPEPQPVAAVPQPAAGAPPAAEPAGFGRSTVLHWPTSEPGNGAAANPSGFEEATSVIPAWQQTDPASSRETVSLQAMPPEEVASGSAYAALLTFESGPFAGRIVALPQQMVSIGRAPDNDVVVGDPATSGHHGRIEVRTGTFWISDLGSTNGTLVNGEPVIEKQLSNGDMIAIGQNTLRFSLEAY